MDIQFEKYEGTGNDFVMIDNRNLTFPKNDTELISRWCNRRFGIGADGLILIENDNFSDFSMVYFNADGRLGSMCGNGGRCAVAFAQSLGIARSETKFLAADGFHTAHTLTDGRIALQMSEVSEIQFVGDAVFLNTGSPHHVAFHEAVTECDVETLGASIRYSDRYAPAGTNVNFVEMLPDGSFKMRTYERGVEAETLSCGTGATAVAVAMHELGKTTDQNATLHVQGGTLEVSFEKIGSRYSNIVLTGPATFVFKGVISW